MEWSTARWEFSMFRIWFLRLSIIQEEGSLFYMTLIVCNYAIAGNWQGKLSSNDDDPIQVSARVILIN